eukprot:s684_g12.t1
MSSKPGVAMVSPVSDFLPSSKSSKLQQGFVPSFLRRVKIIWGRLRKLTGQVFCMEESEEEVSAQASPTGVLAILGMRRLFQRSSLKLSPVVPELDISLLGEIKSCGHD